MRMGGGVQETYLEIGHASKQNALERIFGPGIKHRLALDIQKRALAPDACRRIITNSGWVKRDLMRRYAIEDKRITVIHNGVDTNRFHPRHRSEAVPRLRQEWGLGADDFVMLFLGSGYARKGLDRVIGAFARFAKEHPDVRLVVIGYDSAQNRYERQAQSAGVADKCRFLGGRRDAEACFGAADLYLIPTRFDPFANSTLEGLATGLPVVTTETNGAAEIMTPGVHGTIIATDDELLEAMRYWYPRARSAETRQATRALAEQFTAERTARLSTAVLEAVAQEKRGAHV
jgi:UDP-glucose:(heptosyl)LPS alpha-1,3-glucosyltransferase